MITNIGNLEVGKKGGDTSPITADSLPGILPTKNKGEIDPEKFAVRYQKLNMDEPGDIIELERIETKALRNRGIYVFSTERFIFMDKIFMLVKYIEETA